MTGRHGDDDHDGIANQADPDWTGGAVSREIVMGGAGGGLTGGVIRSALAAVGAVGGQMRPLDDLAAGASDALRQAPPGLTVAGAASFLATQGQESDHFRVTEEYAKNGRYAPWIGRTFEMVTWDYNYRNFGRWCAARGLLRDPDSFVNNPRSLADYRWAWLGGVWFFQANGLWPIANSGDHFKVSQIVNGGMGMVRDGRTPNGWASREAMYQAFLKAGPALLPPAPAPVDNGHHRRQQALL